MDIKLTLTARQEDGLVKQTVAFNSHQEADSQITPEEFAVKEFNFLLDRMADQVDPVYAGGKILEDAIIADPVAVKIAIEAKRAKEDAASSAVANADPIVVNP